MEDHIQQASKHLKDILNEAIKLAPERQALVIFDTESPLSNIITEAYRRALPNGTFVDFATVTQEIVKDWLERLTIGDLIILVQTTSFRLNEFRIRIELFQRGLKTIEHLHLGRQTEDQFGTYIAALAYDTNYYHPLGHALKERVDRAERVVVECEGTKLIYDSKMEDAKLNIGDYSQMKNVGGTFPIGEVFSEASDLTRVNGEALVFAFAGMDHMIRTYEPFKINIKDGILTASENCPEDFNLMLNMVREDEDGQVLVREFGLGINPAMNKYSIVNDITAYERQKGLHLSLGAKHAMYAKPGLKRKGGRYHVDIFIDAQRILINDEVIYKEGEFLK